MLNTDYGRSRPSLNSKKHAIDVIGETYGLSIEDKNINIYLTEHENSKAKEFLANLNIKEFILIQNGTASSQNKEWPIENWNNLIQNFPKTTFIQVGLKSDKRVNGTIDLRGKTSIRGAITLLKYSKVFVGTDSFLNHATQATGSKGIILFGPSTPLIWGYNTNINIYKNLKCSPCIDIILNKKCPFKNNCMFEISVKEVSMAIENYV